MTFKTARVSCCALVAALSGWVRAGAAGPAEAAGSASLWAQDNLIAWCVAPPWDARNRGPEERAEMLEKLGFKNYACNWRPPAVPTFDAEIEAMQNHGITIVGWALYGSDNPALPTILAAFERHHIHPQLWLMQTARMAAAAAAPAEAGRKLTPEERLQATIRTWRADLPQTPGEQARRVEEEADRVYRLDQLVAASGSKIELYNHNGWFGMMDNQLAVIRRLKERGVTDVGIVYNFSHSRDPLHDDSVDFPALWERIKPYVVVVNLNGMRNDVKPRIYLSQGDSELAMMRTIQDSGWRGLVGLIAEKGGDAEITERNNLLGLHWLAAELNQPGSGGPAPFPPEP